MQILAADVFENELGGLSLLDDIVDARHGGQVGQGAKNLGLALEEVQADQELAGVAADHVLEGDRAIALPGIGSQVNGGKAADGQELVQAVAAVEQGARRIGQRPTTALADAFAGRVGDAAGRVGTKVG